MDQYFVELPEKESENIPDFVSLANFKKKRCFQMNILHQFSTG